MDGSNPTAVLLAVFCVGYGLLASVVSDSSSIYFKMKNFFNKIHFLGKKLKKLPRGASCVLHTGGMHVNDGLENTPD